MSKAEGARSRREAATRAGAERRRQSRDRAAVIALLSATPIIVIVFIVLGVVERGGDEPASLEASLTGLEVFDVANRDHVQQPVEYPQDPPVGGPHAPVWQNCGFYVDPVPSETAVHSLEHGAVWLAYDPELPEDEIAELRELTQQQTLVLVTPFAGLSSPVVASAWGRQLELDGADDPQLDQFVRAYRQGPQTPEPGAPCTGGIGEVAS